MSMNAAATLLESGDLQKIAIVCGAERVTYAALRDMAGRAAAACLACH